MSREVMPKIHSQRKLTGDQMREMSEVLRKMVRRAGWLLVWTDEELEELANTCQFETAHEKGKR
jgi:hypothetical protein